jgi:hypothetical protein
LRWGVLLVVAPSSQDTYTRVISYIHSQIPWWVFPCDDIRLRKQIISGELLVSVGRHIWSWTSRVHEIDWYTYAVFAWDQWFSHACTLFILKMCCVFHGNRFSSALSVCVFERRSQITPKLF